MKKMKKVILMLLVLSVFALSVVGCSKDEPASKDDESQETEMTDSADSSETEEASSDLIVDLSDITIGASVMSLQHEFMANLVVGYEEFRDQTDLNILITDGGNMEPEKQVTNVENYITQGVDGMLVQCISVETMKDTLQSAMNQDIPVGIYPYDTSVGATTYFGYNEYEWGYSLGEAAYDWIEEKLDGSATILNVTTSLEEAAIERSKGWTDAINSLAEEGNIEWKIAEATSSEDAMAVVESSLQADPEIDIVLVYNDEMGIGAYEAIIQSNLDTTNMFLGSCDGTDTVLDYVVNDTVYRCTVANDRYVSEIGYYWVQNMVKIVLGMEYEDPFAINTMAITIDNIEEYRSREPNYEVDQELIDFVNNK